MFSEIVEYSKSIVGDSVVTRNEIIVDVTKPFNKPTNFNEKKVTCNTENVHILLTFL